MMRRSLRPNPLTYRQRQILRLVSYGLESAEISLRLGITVDCVKWHRRQILERLGARSSANAVALAYEYEVWA